MEYPVVRLTLMFDDQTKQFKPNFEEGALAEKFTPLEKCELLQQALDSIVTQLKQKGAK